MNRVACVPLAVVVLTFSVATNKATYQPGEAVLYDVLVRASSDPDNQGILGLSVNLEDSRGGQTLPPATVDPAWEDSGYFVSGGTSRDGRLDEIGVINVFSQETLLGSDGAERVLASGGYTPQGLGRHELMTSLFAGQDSDNGYWRPEGSSPRVGEFSSIQHQGAGFSVVPEPGSFLLVGMVVLGLVGGAVWRRLR